MTDKHFKALSWCEKKGLHLQINDNGKIVQSPDTYTKKQADLKVWALYLYLYETKSL